MSAIRADSFTLEARISRQADSWALMTRIDHRRWPTPLPAPSQVTSLVTRGDERPVTGRRRLFVGGLSEDAACGDAARMHELHVVTAGHARLVMPMHALHRSIVRMQFVHRCDQSDVADGHTMRKLHMGPFTSRR
jgi:hypothetical protein